jgi:hypothetical protein
MPHGGKERVLAKNVFQHIKWDRIKLSKFIQEFLQLKDLLKLPAVKCMFLQKYSTS